MQNTCTFAARIFEPLEPRRLLAAVVTDYYPLAGGNTWQYDGTDDGEVSHTTITSAKDTLGGKTVTRFNESTTTATQSDDTQDYYSLATDGLRLLAENGSDEN